MSGLLHVDGVNIVLSRTAITRYRARVDRTALETDISRVVVAASVQSAKPSWACHGAKDGRTAETWVVGRGWAMPLCLPAAPNLWGADFVASTCYAQPRLRKADVRWFRDQAAEDAWAS